MTRSTLSSSLSSTVAIVPRCGKCSDLHERVSLHSAVVLAAGFALLSGISGLLFEYPAPVTAGSAGVFAAAAICLLLCGEKPEHEWRRGLSEIDRAPSIASLKREGYTIDVDYGG